MRAIFARLIGEPAGRPIAGDVDRAPLHERPVVRRSSFRGAAERPTGSVTRELRNGER